MSRHPQHRRRNLSAERWYPAASLAGSAKRKLANHSDKIKLFAESSCPVAILLPGSRWTRDGTNVGAEFGEERQRVEGGPEVGAVAGVDGFYVG